MSGSRARPTTAMWLVDRLNGNVYKCHASEFGKASCDAGDRDRKHSGGNAGRQALEPRLTRRARIRLRLCRPPRCPAANPRFASPPSATIRSQQAHLAARPAAGHDGAVRRGRRRRRPPRWNIWATCRSTPSTSSSAATIIFCGPAFPATRRADLRQAQSVDKSVFEYWTHALSYVPARDLRFFIPAMKLHRREGHKWFREVRPADLRKVMRLAAEGRRADHPRHRRRCADRKGASVGQPQAFEAGAATGVLYRCGHDLRAQRHAQDL